MNQIELIEIPDNGIVVVGRTRKKERKAQSVDEYSLTAAALLRVPRRFLGACNDDATFRKNVIQNGALFQVEKDYSKSVLA
jgi:hypothetical protein